MPEIRIGTSGYSFPDWKGPFYPEGARDGEMLPHYATHFDCAEINVTYYRIPHASVFESMINKTDERFEFIVKVHKQVTHKRTDIEASMESLFTSLEPMAQSGRLKGLLAQFPYSFKNSKASRKHLIHLRKLTSDWPLFVEFRHASWTSVDAIYDFLKQMRIGYVNVDGPPLPNLLPRQNATTTDTAYVRFHGRNSETWWNAEKGDRYDYLYSSEQLSQWKEDVEAMPESVTKVYLFFNNCHHGQAAQNALQMKTLFSEDTS